MASADTAVAPETPPPAPEENLTPRQQMMRRIANLDQRQKLAGAAAIAIAISMLVAAWLWTRAPEYGVLFSNLDERDGGAIVTALQQQNVPYRFSPDGSAILILADQVHDVRLRLAAQGLPKGGHVGFELMENQKLGVSQFLEQVNFQRALEGELARTIESVASVVSARVHLAIPKQSGFLRDEKKPSASVMVTLYAGRRLDPSQVAGIVHLVASSVQHMTYDGVSVVDQNGKLLTERPDANGDSKLDATQLHYVEEVEAGFIKRIESILTPMVGSANFKAQVTADIDFNRVEATAETFRPNPSPDQAIRSQQTLEEFSRDPGPQGVPGALTNQPPVPATAPITNPDVSGLGANTPLTSNRSATLNYELDRNIQHTRQALGQIKRLSVAVVVNYRTETAPNGQTRTVPLTEEELTRITNLVREAMGFNQGRGDSLNVSSAPFTEMPPLETDTPLWKDPEMVELAKEGFKILVLLIALAFVYFAVIRPLMRVIAPPPPPPPPAPEPGAAAGGGADEDEDDEDYQVELSGERGMTFDEKLAWARQVAHDNPKLVANLIKDWMNGPEEGKK